MTNKSWMVNGEVKKVWTLAESNDYLRENAEWMAAAAAAREAKRLEETRTAPMPKPAPEIVENPVKKVWTMADVEAWERANAAA